MAYTRKDYPSKIAIKRAIAAGEQIACWQPGPFSDGNDLPDGSVFLEGPHYPKPHCWCGKGKIEGGVLVSIK